MRLLLALALLLPVCALPQEGKKKFGPPPVPKNLKVLTGMDGAQVIRVMRNINVALGVKCDQCHVQGDFASDDNPKKETARMMMTMVRDINGKFADGKQHVTCYTCHRGSTEPLTAPPGAENNEKR
jgi:Photosynthetic reaction centre cytochrome C subunit